MDQLNYENFKSMVNMYTIPAAVLQVHRNPDGTCGDVIMYAINGYVESNYRALFTNGEERQVEGVPYYENMPREPKFDDICFRAAFKNERTHQYVDTTMMYGYWTENILIPLGNPDGPYEDVGYCLFLYTLNKEMDTRTYSSISSINPEISNFVIKTLLILGNNEEFTTRMDMIAREIREYVNSFKTIIMTITPDMYKFDILGESIRNNEVSEKEIFSKIPYEIVETWEWLVGETNCIIIKNEADMQFYEDKAPAWVATLRENNIGSLILVPFIYQNAIMGYLYITDFDTSETTRYKETLELVAFFLSAVIANHLIVDRLEYLSNIDMLTGVKNRNSMNVHVDELSTKLKLNPRPFDVAFFVLEGLKSINDNAGHNDGDQLLKDAAKLLKEEFKGDLIFRAGGDEFTVIALDSDEIEFEEKIEALKDKAYNPDWMYFAIGHYHDESDGELRLALRYAYELMYKDKDAYYEKHPEKRR